jgi:hypothetical protein
VKISVSLPVEDVAILDDFSRTAGLASRPAALHQAVRLLRLSALGDDYAAAWEEWDASGERAAWDSTAGDGLADAAR